MAKKIIEKLKDNRGETFIETLISIMIAGLASTLILGMVVAGRNIIKNSDTAVEKLNKTELIMAGALLDKQVYEADGFYENSGTVTLERTGKTDESKPVNIISCPEYDFVEFYKE